MVRSVIYFFALVSINMFSCAIFSILIYNLFRSTHTYIESGLPMLEFSDYSGCSFFFFHTPIDFLFLSHYIHIPTTFVSAFINTIEFVFGLRIYIPIFEYADPTAVPFLDSQSYYITIKFLARSSNPDIILFDCLQDSVSILPSETVLVFFRVLNLTSNSIHCISLYLVYPSSILLFVKKLQCFCFDTLLIFPSESIELPVLFFLDSSIILNSLDIHTIYFFYSMILVTN